jgi:hypothetical protein
MEQSVPTEIEPGPNCDKNIVSCAGQVSGAPAKQVSQEEYSVISTKVYVGG